MSQLPEFTAITSDNFQSEVLESTTPVILEFWTEGCKPCQKLAPVIRRFADQLKIGPCNVDENPDLAQQYGVLNIPTLLYFKDGQVVDRAMGTFNDISEEEVAEKCEKLIAA